MAASTGTKSVAYALKLGFPSWFKSIFKHRLKAAIHHNGDAQRPELICAFGDVNSSCRSGFPKRAMGECIDHPSSRGWGFNHQLVHSWRVLASVHLCDSPNTDKPVGVAFEHELLERAHLFQVALLCCPKDAVSQVTNSSTGFSPINGVPVSLHLSSVCQAYCLHLTFPLINNLHIVLWVMHQDHVSHLSARVSPVARPYLLSYGFLLPFS
jgi:hypothetical protein